VCEIADTWIKNGFADTGFMDYLTDEQKITFPWTMIDKITPRPAASVRNKLEALGITNLEPIITSHNTYIAPFVNAEPAQYLVIEDKFPAGRPAFEKLKNAGVYLTDRQTVNRVEKMKVTTCLNPLHTALAVYGCLLGYTSIAEEMKNPYLTKLIKHIGYDEGLPVVTDPQILKPVDFIDEVITRRLPNPNIPDTPQRIATDTSQKIPVRYGETIKSYITLNKPMDSFVGIPLAIAGWFRYLLAVDDMGNKMELSPDPMLQDLQNALAGVKPGEPDTAKGVLPPLLKNRTLFGTDLTQTVLAQKIESYFIELTAGNGAVAKTLEKYV
jgi:fructuronate reductase